MKTCKSGVYPIYPAGGAYIASTSMIYLLLKLMRKFSLHSFPFEDVVNGVLLDKEGLTHKITHAHSFNLDGVADLSDSCSLDYFSVFNLCPRKDLNESVLALEALEIIESLECVRIRFQRYLEKINKLGA